MRDRRPALHAAQRKGRVSHTKRRWLADSIHVTSQLSINTCMVVYQRAPERKHLPGALYSRISLYAGHMMLVAPVAPRTASRLPSVTPPSRSDRSCSRVVITTVCVRDAVSVTCVGRPCVQVASSLWVCPSHQEQEARPSGDSPTPSPRVSDKFKRTCVDRTRFTRSGFVTARSN